MVDHRVLHRRPEDLDLAPTLRRREHVDVVEQLTARHLVDHPPSAPWVNPSTGV